MRLVAVVRYHLPLASGIAPGRISRRASACGTTSPTTPIAIDPLFSQSTTPLAPLPFRGGAGGEGSRLPLAMLREVIYLEHQPYIRRLSPG